MYNEAFAGLGEVSIPAPDEPDTLHARHLYTLLVHPERMPIDRYTFMNRLKEENIGTGVHFVALHLHKLYRDRLGYQRGDFPNAEFVSDRTVSLPLSPKLSDDDVRDVIAAVHRVVRRSHWDLNAGEAA